MSLLREIRKIERGRLRVAGRVVEWQRSGHLQALEMHAEECLGLARSPNLVSLNVEIPPDGCKVDPSLFAFPARELWVEQMTEAGNGYSAGVRVLENGPERALATTYFFMRSRDGRPALVFISGIRFEKKIRIGSGRINLVSVVAPIESLDPAEKTLVDQLVAALSLMNVQNIALEPVHPPRCRGRRKPPKKKVLRWHRLVITPGKGYRKTEDLNIVPYGTGEPLVAAHFARGHFKTYTEEKPLFGKYAGTWWWEGQMRGTPERGFVGKDYELRADDGG